ncbi:hypothetical protein PG996_013835 [Apiospora saccharicola]|uniref:Uncharacterized protein n=1 Tax=Apiospora saccharicola TaxID=335842 RepID=A0ABR1TII5_9PEZI
MVFYSEKIDELARKKSAGGATPTYLHLYDAFMEHIMSIIGIGNDPSFNFILEIVHSGLGLRYDNVTGKAENPLTGELLMDEEVIYNSTVDRVMIDVELELRKKYPNLFFSSCTRLPDVTMSGRHYKAKFGDGSLVPWPEGEKGLAAQLRAIPGGLYPRSDIVVADDASAEIAARTWIDEYSHLDRRDLLKIPYDEWLNTECDSAVAETIHKLRGEFLPTKVTDTTVPPTSEDWPTSFRDDIDDEKEAYPWEKLDLLFSRVYQKMSRSVHSLYKTLTHRAAEFQERHSGPDGRLQLLGIMRDVACAIRDAACVLCTHWPCKTIKHLGTYFDSEGWWYQKLETTKGYVCSLCEVGKEWQSLCHSAADSTKTDSDTPFCKRGVTGHT